MDIQQSARWRWCVSGRRSGHGPSVCPVSSVLRVDISSLAALALALPDPDPDPTAERCWPGWLPSRRPLATRLQPARLSRLVTRRSSLRPGRATGIRRSGHRRPCPMPPKPNCLSCPPPVLLVCETPPSLFDTVCVRPYAALLMLPLSTLSTSIILGFSAGPTAPDRRPSLSTPRGPGVPPHQRWILLAHAAADGSCSAVPRAQTHRPPGRGPAARDRRWW